MLFPVPDTRTVATSSVPPAGGGTWRREGALRRRRSLRPRIYWLQIQEREGKSKGLSQMGVARVEPQNRLPEKRETIVRG